MNSERDRDPSDSRKVGGQQPITCGSDPPFIGYDTLNDISSPLTFPFTTLLSTWNYSACSLQSGLDYSNNLVSDSADGFWGSRLIAV